MPEHPHEDRDLELVRSADPARDLELSAEDARSLLKVSLEATTSRPARASGPGRRAKVLGALAAGALIVTVASPAVAGRLEFLAPTGWFGSPDAGGSSMGSTETDDSEWIDIAAPDFVEYAVSQFPAWISLPKGFEAETFAKAVAEHQTRINEEQNDGESALVQLVNIKRTFETYARCAWFEEWLEADAAGDSKRRDAATAVIGEAATWPATVATDGGGIVEHELSVHTSALAGDTEAVGVARETYCSELPEALR